jgi:tRNA(Ile)-lysidine synthase TilS/MesJ
VVELTDVGAYAAREGKSIEEAGREARYAFLQRTAKELGCQWILTAHHANDNAETVLLNLLRGTGSRGLAGIPAVRDNIARPLLGVTRAEISAYAARHGIAHVTDECNLDPEEATRNLLRQKVLPLLVGVNPRAVENINRAAGIVGRENDTLDALAEAAHMSKSHFSSLFRELNGISPWEYILSRRVSLAAQLLASTDRTVLDIATACGFNSTANFNYAFRKLTQSSPTEYRSRIRKGKES